ncbi:uncharacterized protein LOC124821878 [Vigna umbellata]|uniref:uncharacterized protein LOC124821878 n=1 Tax=Vigna umbellata TaxID=87088 RepID=UPI001F5E4BEA|nr:uncharacterized protein LOC124821878 [Vigna umbellata]
MKSNVINDGLGFITSITFIFLVGIFMSSWLGISLLTLGEWFIKKMPLVSYIYVASKQISVAISPDQSSNAFKEVAIIRHPRVGEYAIGFITSSVILRNRDDDELFCVYVPTNHLYLGDIYLISPNDILRPNLSVREGIEIVISGGMSIPKILTIVDAHTNFAPRKATYASKRSDLLAIKDCVPCCCDQEENSVEFFDLEYDISKGDRNRLHGDEEVEVEDMDEKQVHGRRKEVHGEVREGVVDEGQVDEGLMDVDVHIDELVDNNIEGSVLVEVNVNEENCDLETYGSAHSHRNPNDKGLFNDE